MKSSWQAAKNAINTGDIPQYDRRRKTSLDRLADRYRRFAMLAFVVGMTSGIALNNLAGPWLCVSYMLIMIGLGFTDMAFSRAIRAIDVVTMSVNEVYRRTMTLRRRHLMCVATAMPVVLGWMVWLGFTIDDPYMTWGVVVGAVTGLILGVIQLMRFMADYREVLDE